MPRACPARGSAPGGVAERRRRCGAKAFLRPIDGEQGVAEQGRADELPRIASGVAGLDAVLGGGFVGGGLYIVLGPPGAGKTILANQIAYTRVAAGDNALYVTLLAETYDRMLLNIRGMSFFRPEHIARTLHYISAFHVLEQDGLHGLLTLIRREISTRAPRVLIIDGLATAANVAPSELALRKFIHEMQTQASVSGCTMFLLTSADDTTLLPEHSMVDGMVELGDRTFDWRAERDIGVRKFRGGGCLRGRHAMRIDDDGITVFPRLESMPLPPPRTGPAARVSCGVAGLDGMMSNGIAEGSTTLVLGPTGSGKTSLGLHFLGAATEEAPGLLVGFYESPGAVAARAEVFVPALAEGLRRGWVGMQWYPAAEDHLDRVAHALLAEVRARGVRRLFLDGLPALRGLTPYVERLPAFTRALSQTLRAEGVTSLFSLEVPELVGSVVRAPATLLTPIADNLLLLRYVELGARLRRLISVLKLRDGWFDPNLRAFEIEAGRIRIDGPFEGLEGLLTGFPHAAGPEDGAGADRPGPRAAPDRRGR